MSLLVDAHLNQRAVVEHNLRIILEIHPSSSQLNTHLVTESALRSFEELKQQRLSLLYHLAKNGLYFTATALPLGYIGFELYKEVSNILAQHGGYFQLFGMGSAIFSTKIVLEIIAPNLVNESVRLLYTTATKISQKVVNFERMEQEEFQALTFYKNEITKGLTKVYYQIANYLIADFQAKYDNPAEMVLLKNRVDILKSRIPFIHRAVDQLDGSHLAVTKQLLKTIKVIESHNLAVISGFNDHNILLLTRLNGEDFARGCIPHSTFTTLRDTHIFIPYSIRKIGTVVLPIITATGLAYLYREGFLRVESNEEKALYSVGALVLLYACQKGFVYFRHKHTGVEYARRVTQEETRLVYQDIATYLGEHRDLIDAIRPKLPLITQALEKHGLRSALAPVEAIINPTQ